ncbi:SLBB domain-containing protein [Emcibacter sp.]|uniref:SLBB domain-containing protein n=1 Tax=Emcibacter sp. TaxID=1979954 RepID=UPI003A8F2FF2
MESLKRQAGKGNQSVDVSSPLDEGREREIQQQLLRLQEEKYKELSRLEEDFQARLSSEIVQFGYDLFLQIPLSNQVISGAVSDDYIVGVGDEFALTFQGSISDSYSVKVDRGGQIIIPDVSPVNVVGKRLGDVKTELADIVSETMIGTEVHVALASFRMISVIVAGEVFEPGVVRTTSLSSGLEVLMMAGGVKKTGSLRNIKVYRGDKVLTIDLYGLLLGGDAGDISLVDGDRVVVPVIGPTIAVDGDVVRPAIYELPGDKTSISSKEALALAGGTIRPRGYSISHIRLDAEGRQSFVEVEGEATVKSSEALLASLRENSQVGKVELLGHVKAPGIRSLASASTLGKMIGSVENLEDDPYMLFGAIERIDETTRSRRLIEFSPRKVLMGGQDIALKDRDRVIFFGRKDILYLISRDVRNVILTGNYEGENSLEDRELRKSYCAPLDNLARIISDSQSERFATAVRAVFVRKGTEEEKIRGREKLMDEEMSNPLEAQALLQQKQASKVVSGQYQQASPSEEFLQEELEEEWVKNKEEEQKIKEELCPPVYENSKNLLPFVLEYVVSVDGAIRQPGVYPIVHNTSLEALLSVSGGLSNDANKTRIEVANYSSNQGVSQLTVKWDFVDSNRQNIAEVTVNPGGGVRVSSLFSNFEPGAVLLSGEFREPGVYTIRKGEKLSDLIVRAGGFTEQAYPYGAIFTRKRVKELQQAELKRAAKTLQSAMVSASVKKNINASSVQSAQLLSNQIASAEVIGRVVIEADPVKLLLDPAKDIVLEAGDALYVPKRPNFIVAVGDVLNPGALQFVPGKGVGDYLKEVGSFSRSADEGRVYIVYPNGVARPVNLSSWGGDKNLSVPPGTAIVVPTDLSPYDSLTLVKEIGSIVSSLAVSAASLAVIFTN